MKNCNHRDLRRGASAYLGLRSDRQEDDRKREFWR